MIALEQLIDRVEARHCASGWLGRCPTKLHHRGDRNRSLSVSEGTGGRILLHCFAGCTVDQICSALSLRVCDLFPDSSRKPDGPALSPAAREAIADLRSRLTPRDRVLPITILTTSREHVDLAIARALALTVEQELVQVVLEG